MLQDTFQLQAFLGSSFFFFLKFYIIREFPIKWVILNLKNLLQIRLFLGKELGWTVIWFEFKSYVSLVNNIRAKGCH